MKQVNKEKIIILLCIPPNVIKQIATLPTSSIGCLQKFLPSSENYDLFYDGTILDKTKPFQFYNITGNAQIIGYPKKANEVNHQFYKWLRMSKDNDFKEKISLVVNNNNIKKETARLNDLRLFKIEGSAPKRYYQYTSNKNINPYEKEQLFYKSVISNESPRGICCDPIEFWGRTNEQCRNNESTNEKPMVSS